MDEKKNVKHISNKDNSRYPVVSYFNGTVNEITIIVRFRYVLK